VGLGCNPAVAVRLPAGKTFSACGQGRQEQLRSRLFLGSFYLAVAPARLHIENDAAELFQMD